MQPLVESWPSQCTWYWNVLWVLRLQCKALAKRSRKSAQVWKPQLTQTCDGRKFQFAKNSSQCSLKRAPMLRIPVRRPTCVRRLAMGGQTGSQVDTKLNGPIQCRLERAPVLRKTILRPTCFRRLAMGGQTCLQVEASWTQLAKSCDFSTALRRLTHACFGWPNELVFTCAQICAWSKWTQVTVGHRKWVAS